MLPEHDTDRYEFGIAVTDSERDAVFAVRRAVFVMEQGVPVEAEQDAADASAIHFFARVRADGRIIGAARLVRKTERLGKIGRVAVLPAYRGANVGRSLMRLVEQTAVDEGLREAELDAQIQAVAFYERLDYKVEGPPFLDCGIEHRAMRKRLV